MVILWLVDIPDGYGLRHGGALRYTNFSRGLIARNHSVYYLVTNRSEGDRAGRNEFLEALKEDNCISGFFEIDQYSHPPPKGKLSRLAVHPRIQNWMLRSALAPYKNQVYELVSRLSADVCIRLTEPTMSRSKSTITTGLITGVENRTPHEAFLAFAALTKNEALTV